MTSGIRWDNGARILMLAGTRTLSGALARIAQELPDWAIVLRTFSDGLKIDYYAFRPRELHWLASEHSEWMLWPLERVIEITKWTPSCTARYGRPKDESMVINGPSALRTVDFDVLGNILRIGERENMLDAAAVPKTYARRDDLGGLLTGPPAGVRDDLLGRARHGDNTGQPTAESSSASSPGPESKSSEGELGITLSAETLAEITVGTASSVRFRMELTPEAAPLAHSQTAYAQTDSVLIVTLLIEDNVIEIVTEREHVLEPPGPGQPRTGSFLVKAVRAGRSRLALVFRQGGSEIGTIALAVDVADSVATSATAAGTVTAVPRDLADDDKLALLVDQRSEGGQVFYEYILHSEALGMPYRRLRSQPLLDRGGGMTDTTQKYVERIYERLTCALTSRDDLDQLARDARALGASLCRELFAPDVVKELWPVRDRLKLVQVISWEPYIPWELLRLQDPESGDIDERFLAEYGLVRTLSDVMPPRALALKDWYYLGATFPSGSYPPIGTELHYFAPASESGLRSQGITPIEVDASLDALYDVLADGNFDVLHIACHAESPHRTIDRAKLIIGDETSPGSNLPRLIEVDPITVEAEARLKKRRPLVFLNACETGRTGAVLTAWGGWPNTFLRAGAGAFVGSSWAVRDKPASVFATSFYNSMLKGDSLAEAASIARAAAKGLGDASWLAFKVYGHPRARRMNSSRAGATNST